MTTATSPVNDAATRPPSDKTFRFKPTWWGVVAAVVVAVGFLARIRVWLFDRGLWHDELYVGVNLVLHKYIGLAGGLYWNQTAPPGWLIGEKAIYEFLGPDERLLRFPQLVASLVVLGLVLVVGVRAIGPWQAILATAFVAINPMLLYYSGELKQYGLESMMALIMILATGIWGSRLVQGVVVRRDVWLFAAATAFTTAASYSAVIVLGGALAGLVAVLAWKRLWRKCGLVVLASVPGFLIGGLEVVLGRRNGLLADQDAYFEPGFPADRSSVAGYLRWFPHMWDSFIRTPVAWQMSGVVLAFALIGLVAMWLRGKQIWAAAIGGVFAAAVGAGLVHGLPLAERLALYLIAPLMILVVSGLDGVVRGARRLLAGRPGASAMTALIACVSVVVLAIAAQPAAAGAYREVTDPLIVAPYQHTHGDPRLDNGRALMREVKAQVRPGDVIVAYWYAHPLVLWYGRQYDIPTAGYVKLADGGCDPHGLTEILTGAKRVFYVHLELLSYYPTDFHAQVLADLARHGTIVDSHVYGDGGITGVAPSWTLVDLAAGPDPRFAPPPALAKGCLNYDRERK